LVAVAGTEPPIRTAVTRTYCNGHRVQLFEFAHQGGEIDNAGDTFAFDFVLPSNGLEDLAQYLRQPPRGMGAVQRNVIGWRRQNVTTFIDQRLQILALFTGAALESGKVELVRTL
jgi:hypothetical protein